MKLYLMLYIKWIRYWQCIRCVQKSQKSHGSRNPAAHLVHIHSIHKDDPAKTKHLKQDQLFLSSILYSNTNFTPMLIYNIEFLCLYQPPHWAHLANPGCHFLALVGLSSTLLGLGQVGLAHFGPRWAHWKAWKMLQQLWLALFWRRIKDGCGFCMVCILPMLSKVSELPLYTYLSAATLIACQLFWIWLHISGSYPTEAGAFSQLEKKDISSHRGKSM